MLRVQVDTCHVCLTLDTFCLIPSVDEEITGAFWKPGKGQELEKGREAAAGEQKRPVLFPTKQLPVRRESLLKPEVWSKQKNKPCFAEEAAT